MAPALGASRPGKSKLHHYPFPHPMCSSRMISDTRHIVFPPPSRLRECGNPSEGGISKRGGRPLDPSPRLISQAFHGAPFPQPVRDGVESASSNTFANSYMELSPDLKSVTNHVNEYTRLAKTGLWSRIVVNRALRRAEGRVYPSNKSR